MPTVAARKKKIATAPKSAPKAAVKKKVVATTHVARTPEQVVAEQTGQTYHGVTLTTGNTKKPTKAGVLTQLELKQLQLIPDFNPRSNPGPIEELAASIKAEGLISPLTVRPSSTVGKFEIVAGERRFKALKAASYDLPVSVVIRSDLVGDDERALAVALAENSEDGRSNLNILELGRAFKALEKKGWSIARIAKESSTHTQRVRRALTVIDTPTEVQKQIEEGNWSVSAGLEYARLDENARKSIKDKLNKATTADDIRKLRKAAEREEVAKKAAKGEPVAKTTQSGKPSKKGPITVWKSSREKQSLLQELCAQFVGVEASDIGTPDYHEVRGMIGLLLWERGDRSEPYLPDTVPDKKAEDYTAQVKDLTGFTAVVKAEAAKYEPPKSGDGDTDAG